MLVSRVTDPQNFVLVGVPPKDLLEDIAAALLARGVDADKYYTFYRSVNRALSGRAGRSADMIVREIRSLLERYRN